MSQHGWTIEPLRTFSLGISHGTMSQHVWPTEPIRAFSKQYLYYESTRVDTRAAECLFTCYHGLTCMSHNVWPTESVIGSHEISLLWVNTCDQTMRLRASHVISLLCVNTCAQQSHWGQADMVQCTFVLSQHMWITELLRAKPCSHRNLSTLWQHVWPIELLSACSHGIFLTSLLLVFCWLLFFQIIFLSNLCLSTWAFGVNGIEALHNTHKCHIYGPILLNQRGYKYLIVLPLETTGFILHLTFIFILCQG